MKYAVICEIEAGFDHFIDQAEVFDSVDDESARQHVKAKDIRGVNRRLFQLIPVSLE